MLIHRSHWLRKLSRLWFKSDDARSASRRRASRLTNARFATAKGALVQTLENRVMLTAPVIACTYDSSTLTLTVNLPNTSSNPVWLQAGDYNTTANTGNSTLQLVWQAASSGGSCPTATFTNVHSAPSGYAYTPPTANAAYGVITFRDTAIANLIIQGSGGVVDTIDTVNFATQPASTSMTRTGNLSGNVNVSAAQISFKYDEYDGAGDQTTTYALASNNVTLQSVNSLVFDTAGVPFLGSVTVNSAAATGQPYAGDQSLVGPNWGALGYTPDNPTNANPTNSALSTPSYITTTIGSTTYTNQIDAVIGDTMYLKPNHSIPTGSVQYATVQTLLCTSTHASSASGGFIPQIQAYSNVSLAVTGPGSIIQGAIGQIVTSSNNTLALAASTQGGNITIEDFNTSTNAFLGLKRVDAGAGAITIAANAAILNNEAYYSYDSHLNPVLTNDIPNLIASSVGLYSTGPASEIGTVYGGPQFIKPVEIQSSTTQAVSLSAQANDGSINIKGTDSYGLKIISLAANQGGLAATVNNNQVVYNSTPTATSPTYSAGSSSVTISSPGPVVINSVSATSAVNIQGSSILQGDTQSPNVIGTAVNLTAVGSANYVGQVTYTRGTHGALDTLNLPQNAAANWSQLGFSANQQIAISGAVASNNNGFFRVSSVSGLTLTLTESELVATETDFVTVGTGVIGLPGSQSNGQSSALQLTSVPQFSATTVNGSILLNLGGSLNSTAVNVSAGSANNMPNNVYVASDAQFLVMQSISATSGQAAVNMSSGTIFEFPGASAPTIQGKSVSLTSPYQIGTRQTPLWTGSTGGLSLNMTATTRTSASAYVVNNVVPTSLSVTTYDGNVTIKSSAVAPGSTNYNPSNVLSFTNNALSAAATTVPVSFFNTDGDHGSDGNVNVTSALTVGIISAGISSSGTAGSGKILTTGTGQIRAAGSTLNLTAATGIGTSDTPVSISSANALTLIANTNSGPINLQGDTGSTNTLSLNAITVSGDISARWFGDIALTNNTTVPNNRDLILNSISATGSVSLTSSGKISNTQNFGIAAGLGSNITLSASDSQSIGTGSNPVLVTTASTLIAYATGSTSTNTNPAASIYVEGSLGLTVSQAVAWGAVDISATGDLSLTGNVSGSPTALTSETGAVTQTAGFISSVMNVTITANSIGSPTDIIQTNTPGIHATANNGGIYLSDTSTSLNLTADAIGTDSGDTANNVTIYSAGTINLTQESNATTKLASDLPMGVFNPGGVLTLVAGQTLSRDGNTVSSGSFRTITSSATTAQGSANIDEWGELASVTVNNQGSGYLVAPVVTFSGGGGSGATATAHLNSSGKVTSITVDNAGSDYTSAPTVILSSPGDDVYTGVYSINGYTDVNSSGAPAYLQYPSLVIISGTAEVSEQPVDVNVPAALITLADLTSKPVKTPGNVPVQNATVQVITENDGTQTLSIIGVGDIIINNLGLSGTAGTARIPHDWNLKIQAGTGGSVVFLNQDDTISTTGTGTITISTPPSSSSSVAALGHLMTAGGKIQVSAGGNIALSRLNATTSGTVSITSALGAIIFNEHGQNVVASSTTLSQASSGLSLTEANQNSAIATLAKLQLKAAVVLAAATAANATAAAAVVASAAQAAANLALANSLKAAMDSMQGAVTAAQTNLTHANSHLSEMQSTVSKQESVVHALDATVISLLSAASAAELLTIYPNFFKAGFDAVACYLFPDDFSGPSLQAISAALALNKEVLEKAAIIESAAAFILIANYDDQMAHWSEDITDLIGAQGDASAAKGQLLAIQNTLTALSAAYGVATTAYRKSVQESKNLKAYGSTVALTGKQNEAKATADVLFASPSEPISASGTVTITATGSLTLAPSPDTPLIVNGTPALTLTFDAGGLPVAYTGNSFQAGSGSSAPKPVNFSGFSSVNTINGAGNFKVTGTSGVQNTMSLVATRQQAGTATLNGTAYSFSGMTSFNYQGGSGDSLSVTPLSPSADQLLMPWNLAVKLSGGTGSPSTLTYNAPDPNVAVTATGTNMGAVVEPGVATVGVTNVSQVTVNEYGIPNVIGLTNLTFTLPANVTYDGLPHYATNLKVNGQSSLDGIAPKLTYYSGTIINSAHKVAAPTKVGQYTVVGAYPGDNTWASAIVPKILTISAPPTQVAFTTTPSSGTAGTQLSALKVTIEDASGNIVMSNNSTVTIAVQSGPGGFAAGSTLTATAVNGVATFSNLKLTTVGTYTFKATDGSLTPATTGNIVISAGAASKLAITQVPTTGTAGTALTALKVAIQDSYGNVVTSNTSAVTIAVQSGPGGLTSGSTLTATAVNGVATFSNLILNTAGTYTLKVTDGTLFSSTTGNIVISAGAASAVVLAQVPTTGTAGSQLASFTATIKDAYGNTVTSNTSTVTIAVTTGPGGFTSGSTLTASAVSGVATFSNLTLNTAGTYIFTATDPSLTSAITGNIVIGAAAASKLAFTQVPTTGMAGTLLTALKVAIQDSYGNVVTSNTSAVTIAMQSGPSGFTFGQVTATAASGVATFSNLILNIAGTYTFKATDGSLTFATTGNIVISAAAASAVVLAQVPTTGTVGSKLASFTATIKDAYGNTVTSNTSTVTIAVTTGPGGFTSGSTLTASAVSGVATFSNLTLNTAGTYIFTATDPSLTSAITGNIVIGVGAASKLAITQVPTTGTAGTALTALKVAIQDSNGNVITSDTSTVTIAMQSGPGGLTSGSTLTATAVSGVATFSKLILITAGTYTLKATCGALTSAITGNIVISPGAASAVLVAQPAAGTAGSKLASFTATIRDAYGNTVTSNTSTVTIAVATGPGGFTSGSTLTATAVSGVATFSNLTLNTAGTYTLRATDGSLISSVTDNIVISAAAPSVMVVAAPSAMVVAAPSAMVVTGYPTKGSVNQLLDTITVSIVDAYGNVTPTSKLVTLSIGSGPSAGKFGSGSTLSLVTVNGVAKFRNIKLGKAGTYTLKAVVRSLADATTGSIVVS